MYNEVGEIEYIEGTISDVTQRKLDQDNLNRQYEALRQYTFINSHEVGSHVATMLGQMNIMSAKYATEKESILGKLQLPSWMW